MLSLKFDLLFPSIEAAKEAARKLNARLAPPARPVDPREWKRMQDELRLAREKAQLSSTLHRNLFV